MAALFADFIDLIAISQALRRARIPHALGGSGLMYARGLDVDVRGWDLTTNASERRVLEALRAHAPKALEAVSPVVSRFAYRVATVSSSVDVIGGFAVQTDAGRVALATQVTGHLQGVPLGGAAAWAKLYRALGEREKALRLERLARQGL